MMGAIVMLGNYRTFTAAAGFGTIGWLLITHAVFGIVLGNVYARLVSTREAPGGPFHRRRHRPLTAGH
jgi:hypothetical protein